MLTHRPVEGDLWQGATVLGADPVDELSLLVHPIAVGRGQRLVEDTPTTPLTLLGSRALSSGVLHVRYAPA